MMTTTEPRSDFIQKITIDWTRTDGLVNSTDEHRLPIIGGILTFNFNKFCVFQVVYSKGTGLPRVGRVYFNHELLENWHTVCIKDGQIYVGNLKGLPVGMCRNLFPKSCWVSNQVIEKGEAKDGVLNGIDKFSSNLYIISCDSIYDFSSFLEISQISFHD